ncbi:MAG: hypothetical protein HWD84_11155 [Flavobacteriaceae bacterium]|nr:hypothetical protein [Flavobacteriaceae bacterium]
MDIQLLSSFRYLLETAYNKLNIADNRLLCGLQILEEDLSKNYKIHPEVYGAHWQLMLAMKKNNVSRILYIIDNFTFPESTNSYSIGIFPQPDTGIVNEQLIRDTLDQQHLQAYGSSIDATSPSIELVQSSSELINNVFKRIQQVLPDVAAEIETYITKISLIDSKELSAGTSFPVFGLMYLHYIKDYQNWTAYLEHLVHEAAHHHLFAVIATENVFERDSEKKFYSPLRLEPRPMSAIFHQMFVLSRVIYVVSEFQKAYPESIELKSVNTAYKNKTDDPSFQKKFFMAADTIAKNACLTQTGDLLFHQCCKLVENAEIVYS